MKRIGHLFERIVRFDNLLAAAHNAVRGKKNRQPVAAFYFHLETELLQLERELLGDSYCPRPYRSFWVHEPKQRRICAADVRDRVVHHAIVRVLEPHFEAYFIHDTYACRHGKGTHRAVRRAQAFSRRHRYVLQLMCVSFSPASITPSSSRCWRGGLRTGACWPSWHGSSTTPYRTASRAAGCPSAT